MVQYEKEEEAKKVYVLEAQKRFNQERSKQLADNRQRKAAQKEKDEQMERRMIELAEDAKKRQDQADLDRKKKQRNDMLYMKEESRLAAERKRSAREEERARDLKMQKEYEELLEEQDRKRHGYFQGIRDKQAQLLAKYEQGVGNELARLAEADDARARRHQAEKEGKELADLQERDRWRKNLAESGRVAVQHQLSLQAEQRQKQREDDQRYLEKLRKEAAIAEEKEQDKVRRKKEAVLANAEFLRKQIMEKEDRPSKKAMHAQMNDTERQINREKLERATDPERADGLQSLLGRKRAEYRQMNTQGSRPVTLPC